MGIKILLNHINHNLLTNVSSCQVFDIIHTDSTIIGIENLLLFLLFLLYLENKKKYKSTGRQLFNMCVLYTLPNPVLLLCLFIYFFKSFRHVGLLYYKIRRGATVGNGIPLTFPPFPFCRVDFHKDEKEK